MIKTEKSNVRDWLRRYTRQLGIAMVVAVAIVLAAPFGIQQAFAAEDCDAEYVCMWEHHKSEGARTQYHNPVYWFCYTLPVSWWDRVSSIWNRTPYQIRFFTQADCNGFYTTVGSGAYIGTLWGSGFNDEIRSFCQGAGC